MNLKFSQFTNDALSEMHNLESLDRLSLNDVDGISPCCFTHLTSLHIRSLSISADICQVSGGTMLDFDVAVLNQLSSLKEVRVFSYRTASHRNGAAVIANSLCLDVAWKMKLETFKNGFQIWTTLTR